MQQFLAYLQKTHAYKNAGSFPTTCQYNMKYKTEVTALKDRLTGRFPQVKFVETGWVPGAESATAAQKDPAWLCPQAAKLGRLVAIPEHDANLA